MIALGNFLCKADDSALDALNMLKKKIQNNTKLKLDEKIIDQHSEKKTQSSKVDTKSELQIENENLATLPSNTIKLIYCIKNI